MSPVQPPPLSIASRRHTPAVPLKEIGRPARDASFLLDGEMGIEQKPLHARQPVLLAVGVAPARLHEGKTVVRDKRGHGAAEEIGRRNKIRVEDRDKRRVGMFKPESEIAGLESRAFAAMQDIEIDVFGNDALDRMRQLFVLTRAAVVEDLDAQLVARPVEARRSSSDTHGERAFIAHR